jgi:hypothetical protein
MISLLDKWLLLGRIIADQALPPSAAAVAYVLLNHHNGETGRCDPSRATIAQQIGGLSTRTVATAVTALEARGHFQRQFRGHHRSNIYLPIIEALGDERAGVKPISCQEDSFTPQTGSQLPARKISVVQTGSQLHPNPLREPFKRESATDPEPLLAIPGGQSSRPAKPPKRDRRLYLAKHGCTIDSYEPDPDVMGAWAARSASAVENPVSPETVEAIKDVWRKRDEKPKDFDATYRMYLRKRQEWAVEKSAAHDPKRRAGMC